MREQIIVAINFWIEMRIVNVGVISFPREPDM